MSYNNQHQQPQVLLIPYKTKEELERELDRRTIHSKKRDRDEYDFGPNKRGRGLKKRKLSPWVKKVTLYSKNHGISLKKAMKKLKRK